MEPFASRETSRTLRKHDDTMPSFVVDGVAEIISAEAQQDVHQVMTVITSQPGIMSLFEGPRRSLSNYSCNARLGMYKKSVC